MRGKKENQLVLIEQDQLTTYLLDDKTIWNLGRVSKGNVPDICLRSMTVSREHGCFRNMDGIWFYYDCNGKNGTIYNGKRITPGIGGRTKPIILTEGDVLIFGGGNASAINSKTIWALFLEWNYGAAWSVRDTSQCNRIAVSDMEGTVCFDAPELGTVIRRKDGMAVFMGDVTYYLGDVLVQGC